MSLRAIVAKLCEIQLSLLISTHKKSRKLFHMRPKFFAGLQMSAYGRSSLATTCFLLKIIIPRWVYSRSDRPRCGFCASVRLFVSVCPSVCPNLTEKPRAINIAKNVPKGISNSSMSIVLLYGCANGRHYESCLSVFRFFVCPSKKNKGSGFYPPNLESKSGSTSPQFWAQVPPISDSSFSLHFGLFPSREFC